MKKVLNILILIALMAAGNVGAAGAVAKFTLSPTTGSTPVGSTFKVTVGVDSDSVPIISADVVIDFNATKLEAVSVEPISNPGFVYDSNNFVPLIHNDTGKIEITLPPSDPSALAGVAAKGDLFTITFKGKTTGTAAVNFNCLADSVKESNIISSEAVDIVSCAANQSGSYEITAGSGETTTTTSSTPTPTPSSELPRTGGAENTVILSVLGLAVLTMGKYIIGLK
jgi:hypothetical protein